MSDTGWPQSEIAIHDIVILDIIILEVIPEVIIQEMVNGQRHHHPR